MKNLYAPLIVAIMAHAWVFLFWNPSATAILVILGLAARAIVTKASLLMPPFASAQNHAITELAATSCVQDMGHVTQRPTRVRAGI